MNNQIKCAALLASLLGSVTANATIVEFQTTQGTFQVNLFDEITPQTVENFLSYVNSDSYQGTVIHRVETNFVVQGGGFYYDGKIPLNAVETNAPVVNEPKLSNVRGTIAMAKLSGKKDSATNQWFFNLSDNSANLDVQNGGFSVFGQVIDGGMEIVDKIAQIPLCGSMPLVDFTAAQCTDKDTQPAGNNFITINAITVIDDAPNTAQNLAPKENTLITIPVEPDPKPSTPSSSGGSLFLSLMLMAGLAVSRKRC
ncbi:peptidylprolyl isomerase [Pseudoalteromonas sp. S16_S37]|uniref:peptidylprolyl isomerase n=1 Tax=Pseudoalteromonas sp. S16_S37 TaxID=2720228 RepID=UPI0016816F8E|nr:peptidylprolyl isomerase [Pseudoalteromonas sp. S16_S37]MBD1584541.1 peptidylprolyl isomerase [Pseudoalteromonas sp. S16_S37]